MSATGLGPDRPRVLVVQEGNLIWDERGGIVDAHSSVALVMFQGGSVLVDAGAPGDEDRILSALAGLGAVPDDISIVVYTHSHHDHIGCAHLFKHARHILHPAEADAASDFWRLPGKALRVEVLEAPATLAPGLEVIHTPGHTRGCISLVAVGSRGSEYEGTVVCAGDALPTRDNYIFRLPPGINYDRQESLRSMGVIMAKADWIIPGHDSPIRVHR